MKKLLLVIVALIIVSTGITATATRAPAKVIKLKYSLVVPQAHPFGRAADAWMAKIESDSNGQVDIVPYWTSSLIAVPEAVSETLNGVADIAHIEPGATRYGYPIYKASFGFYYGIPDVRTALKVYKAAIEKYPELEAETSDQFKVVGRLPGMIYQLFCAKPIKSLADFKGMKIRGPATLVNIFRKLGAEGINIPMGEVYMALQKGTIDAALSCYEAMESWKLAEVAPYVTVIDLNSPPGAQIVFNVDSWNSLPADIQKVFEDNIETYEQALIDNIQSADDVGYKFAQDMKVQFISLSDADQAAFMDIVEGVMIAEAAGLDAKGYRGTELYKEIRRLVKEYAQ